MEIYELLTNKPKVLDSILDKTKIVAFIPSRPLAHAFSAENASKVLKPHLSFLPCVKKYSFFDVKFEMFFFCHFFDYIVGKIALRVGFLQ